MSQISKPSFVLGIGLALMSTGSSAFFDFKPKKSGEEDKLENVLRGANQFAEGRSPQLRPFFHALWAEGERNAVLNFNRLALAAMEIGDPDLAGAALDEAIVRIESIYADDPSAVKAKSLWSGEKVKDFKGEPYERSMTYYYRGLLYAQSGDYENARAAFQAAERHDSLSEKEQFQSDFGLMNYLAAWASRCAGDDNRAQELLVKAKAQNVEHFSEMTLDAPYLVLVESGVAPVKIASGKHKEVLVINAGEGQTEEVEKAVDRASAAHFQAPVLVGSVAFQATTRGGRPVQAILDGKAQFKETANSIGTAAVDVGTTTMVASSYSGDSDAAAAGAVIALFGMVSQLVAEATVPEADVRTWDSLPDRFHIFPSASLPPARPEVLVSYRLDDKEQTASAAFNAQSTKCGLSWVRTRSALSVEHGGTARFASTPEVAEADRGLKNMAFRSALATHFGKQEASTSNKSTIVAKDVE